MDVNYIADSIVKGFYIVSWFIGAGLVSLFLLQFKPTGRVIKKFLGI